VYFAEEMLQERNSSLEGKVCSVSGSGNIAIYTIEKLLQIGAKPVTASDSNGMIYDKDGIDLELLKEIKEVRRGRIKEYALEKKSAKYTPLENYPKGGNSIW
ncbi:NADP-specific glutamate dehydrogenase, partial [Staphylococcus pseudintermedius]